MGSLASAMEDAAATATASPDRGQFDGEVQFDVPTPTPASAPVPGSLAQKSDPWAYWRGLCDQQRDIKSPRRSSAERPGNRARSEGHVGQSGTLWNAPAGGDANGEQRGGSGLDGRGRREELHLVALGLWRKPPFGRICDRGPMPGAAECATPTKRNGSTITGAGARACEQAQHPHTRLARLAEFGTCALRAREVKSVRRRTDFTYSSDPVCLHTLKVFIRLCQACPALETGERDGPHVCSDLAIAGRMRRLIVCCRE